MTGLSHRTHKPLTRDPPAAPRRRRTHNPSCALCAEAITKAKLTYNDLRRLPKRTRGYTGAFKDQQPLPPFKLKLPPSASAGEGGRVRRHHSRGLRQAAREQQASGELNREELEEGQVDEEEEEEEENASNHSTDGAEDAEDDQGL